MNDAAFLCMNDAAPLATHVRSNERGVSLIEVMIAALIMTTGVLAVVRLLSLAAATNLTARSATEATILGVQKLEQLRASEWAVESVSGDPLAHNIAGFVDHVDARGVVVGQGVERPAAAVYTRRWSIERIASGSDEAFVLIVRVLVRSGMGDQTGADGLLRQAQFASVKARHSQ
ncbi:MAG TPA: prepilin-type N-terminal cleavage/methylation domain-containing protein [Vicinamibacterales bacterium]|nr:prepilin-type N-terminal cleavage/methylation domain-containing protein [Vicinamibacterales bacterium]